MKIGKLIIIILLLLIACDEDEAEVPFEGLMTADISGNHNFSYKSDNIQVTYQPNDDGLGFIYVSSSMKVADTLFILSTSRNNDTLLFGDTFRAGNKVYESFIYGIDEDALEISQNSISGTFAFRALFSNVSGGAITFDTVNVENGFFSYTRIN